MFPELQTGNDVVVFIGLKPEILINMDIQDVEVMALGKEPGTLISPLKVFVICNSFVVCSRQHFKDAEDGISEIQPITWFPNYCLLSLLH